MERNIASHAQKISCRNQPLMVTFLCTNKVRTVIYCNTKNFLLKAQSHIVVSSWHSVPLFDILCLEEYN